MRLSGSTIRNKLTLTTLRDQENIKILRGCPRITPDRASYSRRAKGLIAGYVALDATQKTEPQAKAGILIFSWALIHGGDAGTQLKTVQHHQIALGLSPLNAGDVFPESIDTRQGHHTFGIAFPGIVALDSL
jgi:hypothetical protein